MMGAQNARTLVKNQCRQNTTSSVFFVRIHVCRMIAPAMIVVSCPRWARGVEADECSQELFESWWRLSHLNVEYRTIAEKIISEVL
jgi:hypothetical protein